MTKTTTMLWLAAGLILTLAAPSRAQTPPPTQTPTQPPPAKTKPSDSNSALPTKNLFVDINGGVQAASHSISTTATPTIYDETATISSSQKTGSGGLFDFGIGYRVWRDLAVAVGFSTTSNKSDAQVSATIPSPFVTDSPKTSTASVSGLKRSERAVNVMAVWTRPISQKMDAALVLGPSFIKVIQGVPSVTVIDGTQDVTVTSQDQSKTTVGFLFGGDISYLFNPRYGVGAIVRYTVAKVDLPAVSGVTAGGFQIGGGFRLRF